MYTFSKFHSQMCESLCISHVVHLSTYFFFFFFFSSRRRHTRLTCDWSSDVCSSDLAASSHPSRMSVMAFGLVYTAEHYVTDILLGWLLAAVVVLAIGWYEARR